MTSANASAAARTLGQKMVRVLLDRVQITVWKAECTRVRIYPYKLMERSSFSINFNIQYITHTYLLRETSVHGSERKVEHLKTRIAGWFIPRSAVNSKIANNSHILLQPFSERELPNKDENIPAESEWEWSLIYYSVY